MIYRVFLDILGALDIECVQIALDALPLFFIVVQMLWVNAVWTVDTSVCLSHSH